MDPKKIWVCNKGHQYTDFNRTYSEIECPYCACLEALKPIIPGLSNEDTPHNDHAADCTRYSIEAATEGHTGYFPTHHVMTEAGYQELKAKAAKWDMIQWAVDNRIEFIDQESFDEDCGQITLCVSELERLEQLYKEREQDGR